MQSSPPANRKAILAIVAFGIFVAADDLTVVSTMLRQIIFDLGLVLPDDLDQAAWIVNAYLIAYVVVMPFIGRVSDIFGRRAVFCGAMILFIAGSVWVPFAQSFETFLAGRVLTALGGGAMVPVGMAVVADIYPAKERASALGILGAIDTAGWVWGPLFGAFLIRFLTWEWQFYLNIPLGLIGLVGAWYLLAHLPKQDASTNIDWVGTAILTGSLLALNVALLGSGDVGAAGGFTELSDEGTWVTWPYYLVAAIGFGAFIYSQQRPFFSAEPLIDLSLFTRQNFSPAVVINFLIGAILIIAMVNVPLIVNVLELEVGQAALTSGYLLSVMTATLAVCAYLGGQGTERFGYRPMVALGVILISLAFALMGFNWSAGSSFVTMGWQLAILGAGFGFITAPIGAAVVNAAPDDQRGIASSLVIVMRLMGMSVGLAGLTSWGLFRFNALRTTIQLPEITDPNYLVALTEGLVTVTIQALSETFVISAVVAGLCIFIVLLLKNDPT